MNMGLLITSFVLGCLALIAVSEEEKLEDYAARQEINRMADRSRKGWNQRRRRAYTKAGWKA